MGVRELVVASMSNAVRSVTVERGFDPRTFAMVTYGGNGPMFIADICRHIGITQIYIPPASATFSAYGLLVSEHARNYVRTHQWLEGNDPAALDAVFRELENTARRDCRSTGADVGKLAFQREADIRFEGQFFEFPTSIPADRLTDESIAEIRRQFIEDYEDRYGAETAWLDSRIEIVNCRLKAWEPKAPPALHAHALDPCDPEQCLKGSRRTYVSASEGFQRTPIYDGSKIRPGTTIEGPAILEEVLTTILIPSDFTAQKDVYENYVLSHRS